MFNMYRGIDGFEHPFSDLCQRYWDNTEWYRLGVDTSKDITFSFWIRVVRSK